MATHLRHITHEHLLGVVYGDDFMCNGCHTIGAGERYHCSQYCQFNLHKECAVSPANISSHLHRLDHQLKLVWDKPEETAASFGHRPCNVCEEEVNGLYFACPDYLCNFVLHPICSKVPAFVHHRHVTDREHLLTLQFAKESECKICRCNCTGWRYRCGTCRIDIHLECLLSSPSSSSSSSFFSSPTNPHDDFNRSRNLGQSKDRRPLDHQHYFPQQATGINSVGMQSSSLSPSLYGLHHNHFFNGNSSHCSQYYIPYNNKPAGGYGPAAGAGVGMTYSPSPPSYGNGTSSQQYLQPCNNNHCPHKPDGSGHHGSPGGSQSGSKRKKMYEIVGNLLAMVVAETIVGFIPM